jgi:uncharacterized protein (DUF2141 family)
MSNNIPASIFRLLLPGLLIISSCAQQGSLTGGPKDEKPPEIISSIPENYSTQFRAETIEITFNEYFALKDIAKQLVVSPPMAKKPEFKIKGKTLEITFEDSLQPDRTYAINFGDALIDLNESNPIKNFQYVFSTGDKIDSLQAGGRVLDALDGKPVDNILVMLYSGTADTLPLKTIPLYICRTNKEGKFTLRNLASGSYKIFALKDANTNYLFDQPAESVAFQDSLITPWVIANPLADSLQTAADSLRSVRDSMQAARDSLQPVRDSIRPGRKPFRPVKDTLSREKDSLPAIPEIHKFLFLPDNIELRLFTEVRPNQYLAGADRIRRDQIRLKFNEKLDSLNFDFLNLPMDSVAVSLEWFGDADTVDLWIMNASMAASDSIAAIIEYPVLDSVEMPAAKTDTVKLRYRAAVKPAAVKKNEFAVSVSVERSKSLDFGQPLVMTTSLPYARMDTSLIQLFAGKDSIARRVDYTIIPDTLRGLILNGLPIVQAHPRTMRLHAGFVPDTAYRLRIFPGAFKGLADLKNDTLDIRFKMKNKDQYGTIRIEVPDLRGPGLLELIDSRSKVVAAKMLTGAGTAVFDLLAPGKYSARMTFDTNANGRWDTGRYIRHIQPEKVISFTKELNLKANWEVSEVWKWEDL